MDARGADGRKEGAHAGWWGTWAPYWDAMEDRHFGREALGKVMPFVASPVLVVGAGLGLIVEELRRRGLRAEGLDLSPTMVAQARSRRGLTLVLGDARALPFADGVFRTVILSSGVVDYGVDLAVIGGILDEARRVTDPRGHVLAAFHQVDPAVEGLYRSLGVIDGERFYMRRIFDLGRLAWKSPSGCVDRIASWTGRSRFSVLNQWALMPLTMPREMREEERLVKRVCARAARDGLTRDQMYDAVPEEVPYRDEDGVRRLLAACGAPEAVLVRTTDCVVARVPVRRAAPRAAAPTVPEGEALVRAEGVRKRYRGSTHDAVHGLTLALRRGEVFGLLGPNGAGKTTTLQILSGQLAPDGGRVAFGAELGAGRRLRRQLGLVPQSLALFPKLSAAENLAFFGRLYGIGGRDLARRVDELLELVGLRDRAGERIERYSTGMMRRLNIAAGLVHRPRLLLLDEPTVGIDPQSRNRILDLVGDLGREGVTVLYTTHYMEEAERLCDRVAIMDHGSILLDGAPRELVAGLGRHRIELEASSSPPALLEALRGLPAVHALSLDGGLLVLSTTVGGLEVIDALRVAAAAQGVDVRLRRLSEPSLESVFLDLTGRRLRDEEAA